MPAKGAQECVVNGVDDWQRAGGTDARDRESVAYKDEARRPNAEFDQRQTLNHDDRPAVVIVCPDPDHSNMVRFHRAFAQRTKSFAQFHDQNEMPICATLEWYLERGVRFVIGRQGTGSAHRPLFGRSATVRGRCWEKVAIFTWPLRSHFFVVSAGDTAFMLGEIIHKFFKPPSIVHRFAFSFTLAQRSLMPSGFCGTLHRIGFSGDEFAHRTGSAPCHEDTSGLGVGC
jgi:hypothetical protein